MSCAKRPTHERSEDAVGQVNGKGANRIVEFQFVEEEDGGYDDNPGRTADNHGASKLT